MCSPRRAQEESSGRQNPVAQLPTKYNTRLTAGPPELHSGLVLTQQHLLDRSNARAPVRPLTSISCRHPVTLHLRLLADDDTLHTATPLCVGIRLSRKTRDVCDGRLAGARARAKEDRATPDAQTQRSCGADFYSTVLLCEARTGVTCFMVECLKQDAGQGARRD
ncbi:hypothetical protein BV25DRAFT_1840937 [Artomyces pyxidatus]|uniref:Uncharacterized protein n=1 Tax=Artomyces pyxidatus TaxID=48021 RepID=A0ACB8SQB6_9AGAM|nr:hypothetical protein BV25DRAFT_1840937 [Artomyces pyxidatus]